MNVVSFDNVIDNPDLYVQNILKSDFFDINDGEGVFKNIQPKGDDEFSRYCLSIFPDYEVAFNFARKSPKFQEEPNFIHKDDMMGDITCILYLNKNKPAIDGTTIYDENKTPICVLYSKFNRMVAFNSDCFHSRNIFDNFGEGDCSRLIQVIFLKKKDDK